MSEMIGWATAFIIIAVAFAAAFTGAMIAFEIANDDDERIARATAAAIIGVVLTALAVLFLLADIVVLVAVGLFLWNHVG